MDLEEAKKTLNKFRKADRTIQHMYKDEILEAFRVFWSYDPSEKEFGEHIHGLVIFPEITYIMVKERYGKGVLNW
jgi:hypothetical protein